MKTFHTFNNFLSSEKSITYLKRTGEKGNYQYWYWHKKFKSIVKKSKPAIKIDLYPCYLHHPNIKQREFQVGDIIFHFSYKQFGVLLSYQNGYWHLISRKGQQLGKLTTVLLD